MASLRSKVLSITAFIPTRDLDVARSFYRDLGFRELWGDDSACGMQIDDCGIILQKFYVKEPAMQPWGVRVLYICDPTGVLWHIGEYA